MKQPDGFSGTLRSYQIKGFSWLAFLRQWGLGACLADDMGLGKTVQALAMVQHEKHKGECKPVLLICPTTVINNWLHEARRFTPNLQVAVHHGSSRLKEKDFFQMTKTSDLIISSYGLVFRDNKFLSKVAWAGVISDEAQNIKNPESKQAKAVRSLKAEYRIALTGTPVENHVGDLWAIMEFLNPGLLGSQERFRTRFHKPITLYQDRESAELLKKIVSPFILRRLKTDRSIIKDLPDKIETKEYCQLTKEQASLYQAVANEVERQVKEAEGIARKGIILAALTRLKQVCNHPAHYLQDNSDLTGRSGKVWRLLELLQEILANGERTLIFTQYAEMGLLLQRILQERFVREALFLHGGVTKKNAMSWFSVFKAEIVHLGFILSLKAGGTGLNLTAANNVIHFDRWWNPAVENQATDRAFRIGQQKNVQVHKLIVAGTLEEKIDELMIRKLEISDKVLDSGEKTLSELSNAEFKNLITLSASALGEE